MRCTPRVLQVASAGSASALVYVCSQSSCAFFCVCAFGYVLLVRICYGLEACTSGVTTRPSARSITFHMHPLEGSRPLPCS